MRSLALLLLPFLFAVSAAAQDLEGASDHPLVPRYEGSEIVDYETEEFTDFALLIAPAENYGGREENLDSTQRLEGALTRITYRAPADRSSLEVFRNYETSLADAGFETIFTCEREACGGRDFNHAASPQHYYLGFSEYDEEQRYLAARLQRPEGDVYAALYVVMNKSGGGPDKDRAMVQLDIVELEPMEQKMVVLESSEMEQALAAEGRVAVYGVLFDLDKDTIREDSKPQLDQLGALLNDNPDLSVLVVGHTDAQGAYDYNLDLSQRRAESVTQALTGDYGVAEERLRAVGLGMAAPVASNRTEEGRARNRRVEIVERLEP